MPSCSLICSDDSDAIYVLRSVADHVNFFGRADIPLIHELLSGTKCAVSKKLDDDDRSVLAWREKEAAEANNKSAFIGPDYSLR
jgi:hypothetical protein